MPDASVRVRYNTIFVVHNYSMREYNITHLLTNISFNRYVELDDHRSSWIYLSILSLNL